MICLVCLSPSMLTGAAWVVTPLFLSYHGIECSGVTLKWGSVRLAGGRWLTISTRTEGRDSEFLINVTLTLEIQQLVSIQSEENDLHLICFENIKWQCASLFRYHVALEQFAGWIGNLVIYYYSNIYCFIINRRTRSSFILSELCMMFLVESVSSLFFWLLLSFFLLSQLCSKMGLFAFPAWLMGVQGEVTRWQGRSSI